MKRVLTSVFLFGLISILYYCSPERNYIQDNDAKLHFSLDTVYFDTIFTTIGTITKSFRVYNPHDQYLKINTIELAGGDQSVFRINVDGVAGLNFENLEIAPKDSMFVFVEATLDPNGKADILRIQDSILFSVNGNTQDVDLVAWGQDVHIIRDSILAPNTIWTADKPYLILDYMRVDTLDSLQVNEGVKVYLHRDAVIHIKGSLTVDGTLENPVEFKGDRLEEEYQELPGQWGFIFFENGSRNNTINYAIIKNGTIGLFVNSPIYEDKPVLTLTNTEIANMSYDGILARGTSILASNNVIGDCGNSCVEIQYEGAYSFTHCTMANYWNSGYSYRKAPSLLIANYISYQDSLGEIVIETSDINKANFNNCIIYGNKSNEILVCKSEDGILNYRFERILTNLDPAVYDFSRDPNFIGIINNEDPQFIDTLDIKYQLDSLSPAVDFGKLEYANQYPIDKNGIDRTIDGHPDLGAYEKIKD